MPLSLDDLLVAGLALGLVILFTLVGVVLALRWLRTKNQTRLDELKDRVRGFQTRLSDLFSVYDTYHTQTLQPYSGRTAAFKKHIDQAAADLQSLYDQIDQLEYAHAAPGNRPVDAAISALPKSLDARRIGDETEQMADQLDSLIKNIHQDGQRIHSIPDDMRKLAAESAGYHAEMQRLVELLKKAGVQGKTMAECEDFLTVLHYDLQRIPAHYRRGAQPVRDVREEQEGAAYVYELLSGKEEAIQQHRKTILEIDKLYHLMKSAEQHLGRNIGLMKQVLGSPIPGLIVTRFIDQVMTIEDKFAAQAEKRAHPDVGDLKSIEGELKRFSRVIQECDQLLSRAKQDVDQIRQLLKELDSGLQETQACLKESEERAEYPLEWDHNRPQLEEMNQARKQLGGVNQARTPDELTRGIATAGNLLARQRALISIARTVQEQHNHLLVLLARPEITGGMEWLRATAELAARVDVYHDSNWDARDEVKKFSRQVGALAELQARLAPEDTQTAVKETQLEARIQAMDLLLRRHLDLRPRAERIAVRLEEIAETERQLRETLQQSAAVVGRTALLVGNNSLLQEIAGVQIASFQTALQTRLAELEHPKEGAIEGKRLASGKDIERVQRSLNDWLARLIGGVDKYRERLQERINRLDQIAVLDDAEVGNARQLLRKLAGVPPVTRLLSFGDAGNELKRCSADWVACETTEHALIDKTGPVEESFQQASAALKEARQAFQNAGALASGRKEWGRVTRVSLDNDRQTLEYLERRLGGLRAQHWSALPLVRELDQIYHELDKLGDRVAQGGRQSEQESTQVASTDEAYTELKRYWEGRAQTEPALGPYIRSMLGRAEALHRSAREGYLRGTLTYEQTLAGVEQAADILEEGFTTSEGIQIKP